MKNTEDSNAAGKKQELRVDHKLNMSQDCMGSL